MTRWIVGLGSVLMFGFGLVVEADGPADNVSVQVRPVPPKGVEVPAEDRRELEAGLTRLEASVAELKSHAFRKLQLELLWPDVAIFSRAVREALTHGEFFDLKDIPKAKRLLAEGQARADALAKGETPWATQPGRTVRGYVSKIDGSVQPYGLVIPDSYQAVGPNRYRVDVWFHGRGETLSEVNFLDERTRGRDQIQPAETIVIHPYGRYCNANKFAGEIDTLEALDDLGKKYRVDDDRISVRGFSMGGAAAWQFAVHYSDRWFAANPALGSPRLLGS